MNSIDILRKVPKDVMDEFMTLINNKKHPRLILLKNIADSDFFNKPCFPQEATVLTRIMFLREYAETHGVDEVDTSYAAWVKNRHDLATSLQNMVDMYANTDSSENAIVKKALEVLATYKSFEE